MKSKQEAKETFLKYGALKAGLFREGVHDEYKAFNISEDEEINWRDEAFRAEMDKVYVSKEQKELQMSLIKQNILILNITYKDKYVLLLKNEIEKTWGSLII